MENYLPPFHGIVLASGKRRGGNGKAFSNALNAQAARSVYRIRADCKGVLVKW